MSAILSSVEIQALRRLSLAQREGAARGKRLRLSTTRLRGRGPSNGLVGQGRFADYSVLISHLRREPTYCLREVSPAVRLGIIAEFGGDPAYDRLAARVAAAFATLALLSPGGQVILVGHRAGRPVYSPPLSGIGAVSLVDRRLKIALAQADEQPAAVHGGASATARFARQSYPDFHFAVVTSHWETGNIRRFARSAAGGLTFAAVEPSNGAARWLGDVAPRFVLRARLRDRLEKMAAACQRIHADFLRFPPGADVVEILNQRYKCRPLL